MRPDHEFEPSLRVPESEHCEHYGRGYCGLPRSAHPRHEPTATHYFEPGIHRCAGCNLPEREHPPRPEPAEWEPEHCGHCGHFRILHLTDSMEPKACRYIDSDGPCGCTELTHDCGKQPGACESQCDPPAAGDPLGVCPDCYHERPCGCQLQQMAREWWKAMNEDWSALCLMAAGMQGPSVVERVQWDEKWQGNLSAAFERLVRECAEAATGGAASIDWPDIREAVLSRYGLKGEGR